MSVLSILDSSGHTEVPYAPDDAPSVERARTTLKDLFGKGWTAIVTSEPGKQGTILRSSEEFVARENEEVVVFPQIVGG